MADEVTHPTDLMTRRELEAFSSELSDRRAGTDRRGATLLASRAASELTLIGLHADRSPRGTVEGCQHSGSTTFHPESDGTITCFFCGCADHVAIDLSAMEAATRLRATLAEMTASDDGLSAALARPASL